MHEAAIVEASAGNVLGHELIGLEAMVVSSTDAGRHGISGRIIDETRNTLRIETAEGIEKIVPKAEVRLALRLKSGWVEVEGSRLVAKPEDRTKVWWRKCHGRVQ